MSGKNKLIIAIVVILIAGSAVYFFSNRDAMRSKNAKPISIESDGLSSGQAIQNTGPVSPITGLSCDNWNRRPIAVMQPADIQARPAAGFSQADMVIEMPAYTSSNTRLMGVYICDLPKEMGAIRSSRHDYIALASGLDAFFVHWGGSHFALDLLKENVVDHMDCLAYEGKYCSRWDWQNDPIMRMEDSGHVTSDSVVAAMKDLNMRTEGNFSGYPHQAEAPNDQRPNGGHLRVAFAGIYAVEYDYDKATNTYLRTWGNVEDFDRNNKQRLAPKNIAVLFASSEQIVNTKDYAGLGLRNPWANVEAVKNTGPESISGRYNNVQIGDPWYDETDSGEAFYYFNGKEMRGSWKKDKSKIDSKLFFYDQSGQEVKFVPGQIWVEILEPGQVLRWEQS